MVLSPTPCLLKTTLEKIATGHPNSRIDELLPLKPPSSRKPGAPSKPFTLIGTAKMNQIEPYCAWLKDTLEKITVGHPNSRIDELLLWHFKPPPS